MKDQDLFAGTELDGDIKDKVKALFFEFKDVINSPSNKLLKSSYKRYQSQAKSLIKKLRKRGVNDNTLYYRTTEVFDSSFKSKDLSESAPENLSYLRDNYLESDQSNPLLRASILSCLPTLQLKLNKDIGNLKKKKEGLIKKAQKAVNDLFSSFKISPEMEKMTIMFGIEHENEIAYNSGDSNKILLAGVKKEILMIHEGLAERNNIDLRKSNKILEDVLRKFEDEYRKKVDALGSKNRPADKILRLTKQSAVLELKQQFKRERAKEGLEMER